MTDARQPELRGRRLLIVEDDYLIAADLALILENQGVDVVGPVPNVAQALELIKAPGGLDGAVLDINLGEETSFPVADVLAEAKVPFLFATGYDAIVVPASYADVPRIEKPVEAAALARLIARRIETAADRAK